jgi:hypothetical protein
MPDHLHVLAQGASDVSHLRRFVQRFKQQTAFAYRREANSQLWQQSYFDRVLRQDEDLQTVADYIFANPVTAGLVRDPEAYLGSGGAYFTRGVADGAKASSLHSEPDRPEPDRPEPESTFGRPND